VTFGVSRVDSGNRRKIAARPAIDSDTPAMRLKSCDPVRKKRPRRDGAASILARTHGKISGTFWTSSRMTGVRSDSMNERGSARIRARTSGSSSSR
jgi:hypothetical protein